MGRGRLFVISGPSGAGKSTIIRMVMKRRPGLRYSVSFTTRLPRGSEKEGRDYFFISQEAFRGMIDAGEFVEWAEVHGHLYGTSGSFIETVMAAGEDVLLDIDVEGAKKLLGSYPEAVSVFVAPPSMEKLAERLSGRRTDKEETIKKRLENARAEMAQADRYAHVLVNDNLEETVTSLLSIIDEAR